MRWRKRHCLNPNPQRRNIMPIAHCLSIFVIAEGVSCCLITLLPARDSFSPLAGKATMSRPISLDTRRGLTTAIAGRYRAADRKSKKAILDEFVKVTGYHRKHAIRILSGKQMTPREKAVGRRGYHAAVDEALIVLWEAADRAGGRQLKALLPTLVEAMERHGHRD